MPGVVLNVGIFVEHWVPFRLENDFVSFPLCYETLNICDRRWHIHGGMAQESRTDGRDAMQGEMRQGEARSSRTDKDKMDSYRR